MLLQSRTGDKAFDQEAEERWAEWIETADVRGLLTGGAWMWNYYAWARRDGCGGVVLVGKGGESRLQFIPRDLVQTPMGKHADPRIVDGVELAADGSPAAFYVQDAKGQRYGEVRKFTRIAARDMIWLVPEAEDLLAHGATCYAQIFPLLDQLDGYVDAVIIAARMAAVFGLIWKEDSAVKGLGSLGTLPNAQGREQRAVKLENGMVKVMGEKGEVVQVQAQQPMQQTPDFIRAMCRLVGLPFGMPLELVGKDMSQVNFASARIGLLGYYRHARRRQKWFIQRCLSRIYPWWLSRERQRREAGMPGAFTQAFPERYWKHQFIPEGWDYTDPVSEAQGDQLQIDMGIKTPRMVAAERGRDYEEMQIELAADRALGRLAVRSTMTRDFVEVSTQQPGDKAKHAPGDEPQGDALGDDTGK